MKMIVTNENKKILRRVLARMASENLKPIYFTDKIANRRIKPEEISSVNIDWLNLPDHWNDSIKNDLKLIGFISLSDHITDCFGNKINSIKLTVDQAEYLCEIDSFLHYINKDFHPQISVNFLPED